ncbi:DNA cytosine methyltransferase [Saccharomonospora iraqiensis]|uniref:DNA cytosine methyltransferase n=1 Tax=Saccharomonospora iraqiensis TaxID=52698 RepID=UPI00022DF489|nr:DNA cytosine methyltransferase [Saccharomonospora iraqiensis]
MSGNGRRTHAGYGVKLVRGPFVRLRPHQDSCADEQEFLSLTRRLKSQGKRLAADLFSGAGGLSLGLENAGLTVVLSLDNDKEAVETHRHHFAGLTLDWDLADPRRIEKVAHLISEAEIDVLAGGPPCQPFSKAGRSMIRHRVRNELRDPHDERRDLWRSYLEVIRLARPAAVVMENVPDMALDREMFILRTMVEELEQLGYSVEERVVDAWRYRVPQFRQRLILVAMRDGLAFDWPDDATEQINVGNAIGDLPEVAGGWRPEGGADGWADYDRPLTDFQRTMRHGVPEQDIGKVFDHITRPVREDDARAFEVMTHKTRYSELPEEFKRYREDIFDDKYKRLDENNLSRTITAHIAKDGYWYIHPYQNRTLTVREAARLQTFPDWFRFAGPPSAAFRQIGNAVPPMLAEHIGTAVVAALDRATKEEHTTREVARRLADWFDSRGAEPKGIPWLNAETRWQAVCAELLLERATKSTIDFVWPVIRLMAGPEDPAGGEHEDALVDMATAVGRTNRANLVSELADYLREHPGALESENLGGLRLPGVGEAIADFVTLSVPVGDEEDAEEPVLATKGVLRVAARFHGDPVDQKNRLTDGRMAVARMIGGGAHARRAHKGLIELAASLCRPEHPLCFDCPLFTACARAGVDDGGVQPLF